MPYKIDKQNFTSDWVKQNFPADTTEILINHLKSQKFTYEELCDNWLHGTEEDVINNHYMNLFACLFSHKEAIQGKKILELGPGLGLTSYLYHAFGADSYHSIEAYEPNLVQCLKLCCFTGWNFTHGSFEDELDNVLQEKFDTLSLVNMIEHLSIDYVNDTIKNSYNNFDYLLLAQGIYKHYRYTQYGHDRRVHIFPLQAGNSLKAGNAGGGHFSGRPGTDRKSTANIIYYEHALIDAGWKIKFSGVTDISNQNYPQAFPDQSNVIVCVK